ncbi:MAG: hypothetical protein ACE5J2_01380 [Nitrososphaerales archaeon]
MVTSLAATTPVSAQDTWFPGEGITKGLMVKYRISYVDLNNATPFIATLWFKDQNDKGDWVTDVIIKDGTKVLKEEMIFSGFSLTPLGAAESEEMRRYKSAIKETLSWLSGYSNKIEQESLSTGAIWGVIAAIGGGGIQVKVFGTDKVQVPAGQYDTYIIGFHYAVDSMTWVVDNFPIPVKARIFTIYGEHPIPVQFEYELLESAVVEELPEIATTAGKITPPLTGSTTSGFYVVKISWKPEEIRPNEIITFDLLITDKLTNEPVKDLWYDFRIVKGGELVKLVSRAFTESGEGSHTVEFSSPGTFRVIVNVLGVGKTFGQIEIDRTEFSLSVIPEFPVNIAIVMMAVIAIMLAMTRIYNSGWLGKKSTQQQLKNGHMKISNLYDYGYSHTDAMHFWPTLHLFRQQ